MKNERFCELCSLFKMGEQNSCSKNREVPETFGWRGKECGDFELIPERRFLWTCPVCKIYGLEAPNYGKDKIKCENVYSHLLHDHRIIFSPPSNKEFWEHINVLNKSLKMKKHYSYCSCGRVLDIFGGRSEAGINHAIFCPSEDNPSKQIFKEIVILAVKSEAAWREEEHKQKMGIPVPSDLTKTILGSGGKLTEESRRRILETSYEKARKYSDGARTKDTWLSWEINKIMDGIEARLSEEGVIFERINSYELIEGGINQGLLKVLKSVNKPVHYAHSHRFGVGIKGYQNWKILQRMVLAP